MNKITPFNILVALVSLDIGLTILAVGFFGATEINPLFDNFPIFMAIKIVASVIGLLAAPKLRETPGWTIFVCVLIALYGGFLVFNSAGIFNIVVI
jgi:hypothetical protein